MCGILCCLSPTDHNIPGFSDRLKSIKHRGPDDTSIKIVQSPNTTTYTCGFVRNAISNVLNGSQPIESNGWMHVHNGEFYNEVEHKESDSYFLNTMTSDTALAFPSALDGIFAYCSYDIKNEKLYVARDRIGVIPLYYVKEVDTLGTGNDTQLFEHIWFASEAKALIGLGDIHMFPPNTIMEISFDNLELNIKSHDILPSFRTVTTTDQEYHDIVNNIQMHLDKAVYKRKQDEVPWATALSGGLDSNFIGHLVKNETDDGTEMYYRNIQHGGFRTSHSFSIGLSKSTDLKVAKDIATSSVMHSIHHEVVVTVDEALNVLPDVIFHLETYDVTTIRAGVMNYLLAKYMKKFGIKVAFSGEGSDELMGGYLYFHHCPDSTHMQYELIRKLKDLCYYDCLRCNKAFAAFGIECRVPYLDRDFVNYVMGINPVHKLSSTHPDGPKQEKHMLRQAFLQSIHGNLPYENFNAGIHEKLNDVYATHEPKCNPRDFVYRQKDQFSDSVGKEWIQGLIEDADHHVTDAQLNNAAAKFPFQTPKTKEAYRYREIFEQQFLCSGEHFVKYSNETVACSTKIASEWVKDVTKDPSGNYVKKTINKT